MAKTRHNQCTTRSVRSLLWCATLVLLSGCVGHSSHIPATVVAEKALTSTQVEQILLDREAYRSATIENSIERSKKLLRWIAIGDPEEWVLSLFGAMKPGAAGYDQAGRAVKYPLVYPVPGQDFIVIHIEDGKVSKIDRIWMCG